MQLIEQVSERARAEPPQTDAPPLQNGPVRPEDPQRSTPQDAANSARLHPKEHGAYAILGFPVLSAFVFGGVNQVSLCIAAASVAAFLAHEPLLVAWGHRGRRAQQFTPGAKSRLAILLSTAIVTGVTAVVSSTPEVRFALLGCLAVATIGFLLAVLGKHRTLYGQMWGVVALSAPCVPMMLAGGVSAMASVAIWATWMLGFSASTMAVRSVIAAQKRQPRTVHVSVLVTISLVIGVAAAMKVQWPLAALPLATLPMVGVGWYLMVWPPSAKHLKRVGWSLVVSTAAALLLLIQNSPV